MTPPPLVLLVAVGGAVGAVLRHLAGLLVEGDLDDDAILAVTLAVNAIGTLLLGLLPLIDRIRRSDAWRATLGPGLLGGFTTLSAVNQQTRDLLGEDRLALASTYLVGSAVVCVLAAAVAAQIVASTDGRATP